jgi:transposase
MIQLTPHMRIILSVEPVDFRKGIDGLSGICRIVLKTDPFSGYLFVFMNKRKTAIKMLVYDGQGFWLCQKRLSKGRFKWWPDKVQAKGHGRNGASSYSGADKVKIPHGTLKPKDNCPKCLKGKLYEVKVPKIVARITGKSPLQATVLEMQNQAP